MEIKEAYKQKMAAQLKQWSAQINLLEAKVKNAEADMKAKRAEGLAKGSQPGGREVRTMLAARGLGDEKIRARSKAPREPRCKMICPCIVPFLSGLGPVRTVH